MDRIIAKILPEIIKKFIADINYISVGGAFGRIYFCPILKWT